MSYPANRQKQPPEVFRKKGVLKNFATFKGKHLCWSPFFYKVAGLQACNFITKRLLHSCFPVKFEKFLRAPILNNICKRLLLNTVCLLKQCFNASIPDIEAAVGRYSKK